MNVFESELKNGRFVVGECPKCSRITWPPSQFCRFCFGALDWRQVKEPGVIIETSSKEGSIFGIAEFEGQIRIIGMIESVAMPEPGQAVTIARCGFDGHPQIVFAVR